MSVDLEQQLASIGEEISRADSELSYWKQFCDVGQHDNDKTIHLLEQELVDMEASFTEISSMNSVLVSSPARLQRTNFHTSAVLLGCIAVTNSVIGVSRPPVLDCGTTFHLDYGGRDLPSTPSVNLWKLIYLATEALSDSFECIGTI